MTAPKITIRRLSAQAMFDKFGKPYFGYTLNYPDGRSEVWLRSGLPERAMRSVETHELQHAQDHAFLDGWVFMVASVNW